MSKQYDNKLTKEEKTRLKIISIIALVVAIIVQFFAGFEPETTATIAIASIVLSAILLFFDPGMAVLGVIGSIAVAAYGTPSREYPEGIPILSFLGLFLIVFTIADIIYIVFQVHILMPKIKKYDKIASFEDGVLTISERSELFKSYIKIEPFYFANISYKPESLVYTGATVGGITTGGVHKEGGYNYISSTSKTKKCDMVYTLSQNERIAEIQLTPRLAKIARENKEIGGYVNEKDRIIVITKITMTDIDGQMLRDYSRINTDSAGVYNIAQKYAEMNAPTYEKCMNIINWLSDES